MLNLWVAATGTVEGLSSMGDRTQNYIVARKLLLDSADAVERIMLAQKQISELDGYVTRVTDMLVRVYPPLSICARHVRSCVPCVLCVSCVPCAVCCFLGGQTMVLTGDAEQALETVRAYCRLHPRDPHGLRYVILFILIIIFFSLFG